MEVSGRTPVQLLNGMKILDLSRVLAGPYATMVLADSGADVIKVEHPDRGDDTRHWARRSLAVSRPISFR